MKKNLWLVLILLSFISKAQENKNSAVLLLKKPDDNKYVRVLKEAFQEVADNRKEPDYYFYEWDEKKTLRFLPGKHSEENVVSRVHFVDFRTRADDDPKIVITTDTSGKTKSVHFPVFALLEVATKTVDLATSQVIDYSPKSSPSLSEKEREKKYDVVIYDFVKEFGGDPALMKKKDAKEYQKIEDRIKAKYKPLISERILELYKDWGSSMAYKLYDWERIGIYKFYSVVKENLSEDENKIRTINSTATSKDGFRVGHGLTLYEVIPYGNYTSTKLVHHFTIKKIDENGSELDMSMMGNRKKLAEIMKSGNEMVLTNSPYYFERDYNRKLNKLEDFKTVAVRKSCFFCESRLETNLLKVPSIKLIERAEGELRYFRNLAKSEKFIDLDEGESQYKQLGVNYLFYSDNSILKSTDIETGRIIGSVESEAKFLGASRDDSRSASTIRALLLETFNKQIEVLSFSKESKGKIKEMIIGSPYGISDKESFKIFIEETEEVNGKKINRLVQIGDGNISDDISDLVGKLNVKDGEKEVFEAKTQGKKIIIKYNLK
ncbi:hypothetical protein GVN16_04545 [Emticicia sp. CRIBPO]|uniref:hypothetical protein n=1 Tax=Emticicia sp. CRIBPO TaxID=2683258 RepID=UPI0014120FB5|nr:hypothetical protein [Emticicia sp. CRIBPO]NBA85014.1 hypothetical protein [Emticicia sp. CRIBPO]